MQQSPLLLLLHAATLARLLCPVLTPLVLYCAAAADMDFLVLLSHLLSTEAAGSCATLVMSVLPKPR
jgi:hypothetical protein